MLNVVAFVHINKYSQSNNGVHIPCADSFRSSDTSDESTTFTDSSSSGHTITASGNIKHNSVPTKFGSSSIELDGAGDELDIASTSDFQFGTGDFTIDWWMMPTTVSGTYLGLISITSSTTLKNTKYYVQLL